MLRRLPLCLCFVTPLLQAAEPPRDLSYSLGVELGQRLHQEMPDLALDELLDGLRQAYRGEPLRLTPAQMQRLLSEHEQQLEQSRVTANTDKARAAEGRFLANEKAKPGVRELGGGVLRTELQAGQGAKPTADGRVQVRYRGWLADGSQFDASESPQWFRLDSVIEGWRIALQEMPRGAKWRVVIPSARAYGAAGAGDLIPPYAPLVFEIELLDIAR